MNKAPLLIEIGCEELPANATYKLSQNIGENLFSALQKLGFTPKEVTHWSTPRRLAWCFHDLPAQLEDQTLEKTGPFVNTIDPKDPKTIGFAHSCGLQVDALTLTETPKGSRLSAHIVQTGRSLKDALAEHLPKSIQALQGLRAMRWGDGQHAFLRPVHWLLCLHGEHVLPCSLFDIKADRYSYGHRFLNPKKINIINAEAYASLLEKHHVIPCPKQRQTLIEKQHQALSNGRTICNLNSTLLKEVVALVEWPVSMIGSFDKRFLSLPQELIESVLHQHQRCFTWYEKELLSSQFSWVSNIESQNVQKGNERVVHARLNDAWFFMEQDKKTGIDAMLEDLKKITYRKDLGTMYQKAVRISGLSEYIAKALNENAAHAKQAGIYCKADLASLTVGEFPEIAGIVGQHLSTDPAVANAIASHLYPHDFHQTKPSLLGAIVAISDKIDDLTGAFGQGIRVTGSKDPFGLRRAMHGVLRIAQEHDIDVDLMTWFTFSASLYQKQDLPIEQSEDAIHAFACIRLQSTYRDHHKQGHLIDSLLSHKTLLNMHDLASKLHAVHHLIEDAAIMELLQLHKRVGHIISNMETHHSWSIEKAQSPEEKQLIQALEHLKPCVDKSLKEQKYLEACQHLLSLKDPLQTFFDHVMVMSDDMDQQKQRIGILQSIYEMLHCFIDFDQLSTMVHHETSS